MYEYQAELTRIVDGDTLDCIIDIGFSVFVKKRIRLYGIDTWESWTRDLEEKQKGLAAKDHMEDLLGKGVVYFGRKRFAKDVVLFIPADEDGEIKDVFTFNRVLGHVFVDGEDMSERMVMDGHATKKKVR